MNFVVFVLLNLVVLIRPSEMFEAIYAWPLYNVCILVCLAISVPQILLQFLPASLISRPITVSVLALLPAVAFSHLIHANFEMLFSSVDEFLRFVLYYLLLIGAVTTKERLRSLMFWITIFLGILATLTLLNLYGVIQIPALMAMDEGQWNIETGEKTVVVRLQASGIFNNPNAYSRILTTGMLLSLYWLTDPKMRIALPFWLGMLGVFGYTQMETKSRGGFLGFLVGLAILFLSRFGLKRGLPFILVCLPVMLAFGGRSAELSTSQGTAAHRIELWDAGLNALKGTRFLGIGMNMYQEEAHGFVAHNSFVHAYVELGLFGGTLFTGIIYLLIKTLVTLRKSEEKIDDLELRRLRPYMLAIIGAETVGLLSISRCYVTSTFLMIGMGAVYLDLVGKFKDVYVPRLTGKLVGEIAKVGVIVLVLLYAYVAYKMRSS